MIEEISIRDLGVIADATLPLGPGFTAVTGETGAGKTMVVTALGLLLGERADTRRGALGSPRPRSRAAGVVPADGRRRRARARRRGRRRPVGDGRPSSSSRVRLGRGPQPRRRRRPQRPGRRAHRARRAARRRARAVRPDPAARRRTAQREALDRFAGAPLAAAARRLRAGASTAGAPHRAELDELVADRDARAREADDLRVAHGRDRGRRARSPARTTSSPSAPSGSPTSKTCGSPPAVARELLSAEASTAHATRSALARQRAPRSSSASPPHDAALAADRRGARRAPATWSSEIAAQLSSYLAALDTDGGARARDRAGAARRARRRSIAQVRPDARRRHRAARDAAARACSSSTATPTASTQLQRRGRAGRRRSSAELADGLSALRAPTAAELARRGVTDELTALAMADAAHRRRGHRRATSSRATGRDQVAILLQPHSGSRAPAARQGRVGRRALARDARDRGRHRRRATRCRPSSSTRSTPASAAPPRSRSAGGSRGSPSAPR